MQPAFLFAFFNANCRNGPRPRLKEGDEGGGGRGGGGKRERERDREKKFSPDTFILEFDINDTSNKLAGFDLSFSLSLSLSLCLSMNV